MLARGSLVSFHLLLGNLSLVGPRLLLPRRFAQLDKMTRQFLRGAPGVFSLKRIHAGAKTKRDKSRAAIIYYSRNNSLALDLQILLDGWRRRKI